MSLEHAKKFIAEAKKNEALRKKVNESADHIVKVAKENGYEVTHEEIRTALKEHWTDDPASGVLSEAPGF